MNKATLFWAALVCVSFYSQAQVIIAFGARGATTSDGSPAVLAVDPDSSIPPSAHFDWEKGSNGIYFKVVDGANISGSQTTNLVFNPAHFADAADYICVATAGSGSATSLPVHLTVIVTNTDITSPSDVITAFGDLSGGVWEFSANPANAIDDSTTEYINGGSGFNAAARFPPFVGPVGLIVVPAAGATQILALRIYPGQYPSASDPADYRLEGSTDGGASYNLIASGPLSLPAFDRNDTGMPLDPLRQSLQEARFPLAPPYTAYRLSFNNVRDNNTANCLRFAEFELLGFRLPKLSCSKSNRTLFINSTIPCRLQSTTNLPNGIWSDEGSISNSIAIELSVPVKFFRAVIP